MSMHGFYYEHTFSWLPLLGFGLFVWFLVRILHKSGHSGWWVLVMFVPLINVVAVWLYAFAEWPFDHGVEEGWEGVDRTTAGRLRELDTLRRQGLISEEEYAARRKAILDGI